eukprot:jgi/Bigna1/129337/aug1.8_g4045
MEFREKKENGVGALNVPYTFMSMHTFLAKYREGIPLKMEQVIDIEELQEEIQILPPLRCARTLRQLGDFKLWFSSGGIEEKMMHTTKDVLRMILDGEEEILLVDPIDASKFLYMDYSEFVGLPPFNQQRIDLSVYPLVKETPMAKLNLQKGDLLYIPLLWAHQIRSKPGRDVSLIMEFESWKDVAEIHPKTGFDVWRGNGGDDNSNEEIEEEEEEKEGGAKQNGGGLGVDDDLSIKRTTAQLPLQLKAWEMIFLPNTNWGAEIAEWIKKLRDETTTSNGGKDDDDGSYDGGRLELRLIVTAGFADIRQLKAMDLCGKYLKVEKEKEEEKEAMMMKMAATTRQTHHQQQHPLLSELVVQANLAWWDHGLNNLAPLILPDMNFGSDDDDEDKSYDIKAENSLEHLESVLDHSISKTSDFFDKLLLPAANKLAKAEQYGVHLYHKLLCSTPIAFKVSIDDDDKVDGATNEKGGVDKQNSDTGLSEQQHQHEDSSIVYLVEFDGDVPTVKKIHLQGGQNFQGEMEHGIFLEIIDDSSFVRFLKANRLEKEKIKYRLLKLGKMRVDLPARPENNMEPKAVEAALSTVPLCFGYIFR